MVHYALVWKTQNKFHLHLKLESYRCHVNQNCNATKANFLISIKSKKHLTVFINNTSNVRERNNENLNVWVKIENTVKFHCRHIKIQHSNSPIKNQNWSLFSEIRWLPTLKNKSETLQLHSTMRLLYNNNGDSFIQEK